MREGRTVGGTSVPTRGPAVLGDLPTESSTAVVGALSSATSGKRVAAEAAATRAPDIRADVGTAQDRTVGGTSVPTRGPAVLSGTPESSAAVVGAPSSATSGKRVAGGSRCYQGADHPRRCRDGTGPHCGRDFSPDALSRSAQRHSRIIGSRRRSAFKRDLGKTGCGWKPLLPGRRPPAQMSGWQGCNVGRAACPAADR